MRMKFSVFLLGLVFVAGLVRAEEEPKLLAKVTPLPVALDPDFEFRKTKLFSLTTQEPKGVAKLGKAGRISTAQPGSKTAVVQDASIAFERQYRLYGAVTAIDKHQRYGDYFDFFWRAKRTADVKVRLEYRQEKLHSFVQAQEASYSSIRGNHKTEFKVIGDDYENDGRVIAWRCLLINNGQIVAENRSYLWE
jgi:hypothetical protein